MVATPATPACWAQMTDRRRARPRVTCRWSCRPATTTAAIGPGNGLFGESLVALDLKTGTAQMALPARAPRHLGHGHPVRADPRRHHRRRTAPSRRSRSRPSRAGSTCSIASTGKPVWPIEERAGRKGRRARRVVLADAAVRRPSRRPYDRQGVSLDDLIDFTPELQAEAEVVSRTRSDRSSRRRSQQVGVRWPR